MTLVSPASPASATAPVSIAGVLVDSTGASASWVDVHAYAVEGPGQGTYAGQDLASVDGTFSIDGLEAGREYRLFVNWSSCCSSPRVAPSFAGFLTDDPVDRMTQDPLEAALFVPGPMGLTGLRLQLEAGTAVSGRVTSASGSAVAGIQVYVYTSAGYNDIGTRQGVIPTSVAYTAEDGTFRVAALEYVGDEVDAYVVRVDAPGKYPGYVGVDASVGLVPIDAARRLQPGPDEITGLNVTLPEVELPADQIILGPRIAPYKGGSPGGPPGQIMAVGDGTLSVFSFEDGVLTRPEAIRVGFDDERVYAPGDWGGVPLDWLLNENPESSHFEYRDDIISVDQRGDMYLYEGDGAGHLREPRLIGWGWNGYRVIPSGDLDGDHHLDLLAIDPNGYLKLYRGDGKGGFFSPYPQVGWGWIGFDLYAAGDLTQDGRKDILSVDPSGILYLYPGNGDGTFQDRRQVGYGWGTYTLAAGADIDGYTDPDTGLNVQWAADIVGRDDATGDLYLYSGKGDGTFPTKRLIATGW
ncbi:FG-GAP-like repeat-containing protein [Agromyces sp. NPDC004153]